MRCDKLITTNIIFRDMEIIWFASGTYGFLGSVLLIVFHILPQLKVLRSKGRFHFFEGKNDEEIAQSIKHYSFYSQIWSFRLISTSFLIIILFSLSIFEYSDSLGNILYIIGDSIFLFIFYSSKACLAILIHFSFPKTSISNVRSGPCSSRVIA